MNADFIPVKEAGVNEKGEILYDAGELKNIDNLEDDQFSSESVKRTDILDFGDEGFLVHGLLTAKECQHYIERGEEVGLEPIWGTNDSVRSSQRITFRSPQLAKMLWNRLKPFVKEITIDGDPHLQHIDGVEFLLQGRWEPHGLNDIFRLCRYLPTGHFGPHFDGHFVRSASERSLKTLMLYLNGDFTGGSTNFVDEKQNLYKDESGKYCAEEKNILCHVQPETGMGIIFNHHRLHEGQKLGDNKKYILRTDIIFENIIQHSQSPAEEKALQMVQEAERKEACGNCMEAMELYRKAFKLSPALAKAYGN